MRLVSIGRVLWQRTKVVIETFFCCLVPYTFKKGQVVIFQIHFLG